MKRLSTFEHALLVLSVKNYAANHRGAALVEKISAGYVWIAETDAEDALLLDATQLVTETPEIESPSIIRRAIDDPQLHFDTLDAARALTEEKKIPLQLPLPRDLDSDLREDR